MNRLWVAIGKTRNNLVVYMLWDVPMDKVRNKGSIWEFCKYLGLIFILSYGLFFSNLYYADLNSPPSYMDMEMTEGYLSRVVASTSSAGGVRIWVADQQGNEIRFPGDSRSLPINVSLGKILKKSCLRKPIVVRWTLEKYLIYGDRRHVWEMETCQRKIGISYSRESSRRLIIKESREYQLKIISIISLLCIFRFSLNYREALFKLRAYKERSRRSKN